jgi:hypothetical protein
VERGATRRCELLRGDERVRDEGVSGRVIRVSDSDPEIKAEVPVDGHVVSDLDGGQHAVEVFEPMIDVRERVLIRAKEEVKVFDVVKRRSVPGVPARCIMDRNPSYLLRDQLSAGFREI